MRTVFVLIVVGYVAVYPDLFCFRERASSLLAFPQLFVSRRSEKRKENRETQRLGRTSGVSVDHGSPPARGDENADPGGQRHDSDHSVRGEKAERSEVHPEDHDTTTRAAPAARPSASSSPLPEDTDAHTTDKYPSVDGSGFHTRDEVSLCTPATQRDVDGGWLELLAKTVAQQTILPLEWLIFLSGVTENTCQQMEQKLNEILTTRLAVPPMTKEEYVSRVRTVANRATILEDLETNKTAWVLTGPDTATDPSAYVEPKLNIPVRRARREPLFDKGKQVADWVKAQAIDKTSGATAMLERLQEFDQRVHNSRRLRPRFRRPPPELPVVPSLLNPVLQHHDEDESAPQKVELKLQCHSAVFNQGWARNRLAEMARGTILSYVDADDGLHPIRTEILLRQFWNYPSLKMVGHRRSEGPRSEDMELLLQLQGVYNATFSEWMYYRMLRTGWFIGKGAICVYGHVSVRKEVFREIMYDEEPRHVRQNLEDMYFIHKGLRLWGPRNDSFSFVWNELTWGVKAAYREARLKAQHEKKVVKVVKKKAAHHDHQPGQVGDPR
ncbi:unnamed protein product [Amoebophrya sp. A120]|nr:unnamed protein product [Amoebophrya sp. A120]|eukprot:GSA120T00001978001.1